jgi:uncharacterized DUF497 family protein
MEPYWDQRNREHIAKHDVTPEEVDQVFQAITPPFPEEIGEGKYRVEGQSRAGRYLHVIFVYRPVDSLDWNLLRWEERMALLDENADEVVYVIHARDLTESEKRALRRRIR